MALSTNELLNQILRDQHLTFKKKCYELIFQIYGHEALIENKDTALTTHCGIFDVNFYRFNTIKLKHLAWRKLCNPFKFLELLIVAPLELLSWCVTRPVGLLIFQQATLMKDPTKAYLGKLICISLLFFLTLLVNVPVNITTGIVRRFLAPVRYIIRPAIQTANHYPTIFFLIVVFSLGITVGFAALLFTGGLPIITSSLLASSAIAKPLLFTAMTGVFVGNFFTKAFQVARNIFNLCTEKKPEIQDQLASVDRKNQRSGYPIYLYITNKSISVDTVIPTSPEKVPLVIHIVPPPTQEVKDDPIEVFVYGRRTRGTMGHKKLRSNHDFTDAFKDLCAQTQQNTLLTHQESTTRMGMLLKNSLMTQTCYDDINEAFSHFPEKIGATEKMTESFHAVDPQHTVIKKAKDQSYREQTALFFGLESVFFPPSHEHISADKKTETALEQINAAKYQL